MAEPPEGREPTSGDAGADEPSYLGAPPGAPRWVKVAGLVVAVIVALVVALLLTGRFGEHGPGRHGLGAGGITTLAVDRAPLSGGRG